MADIQEAIRRLKYLYEVHGADQVAAAQAAITRSTTETERASLSLEKSFNNMERRYVSTVRAQQDYQRVQEKVNDAVKQNPALQERGNVILQNAQQQYLLASRGVQAYGSALNKGTGEARLARHELINLSRQVQDVGVSLASGQAPLTVLVQQGSQIADVFASSSGTLAGFFRQIGTGAARFIGSAAGIATSVATMGAAIGYAAVSYGSGQREIEKSLTGIGRASDVTRDQINGIASASSSAFGLSTSEARTAASTFAATGKASAQSIGLATQALDAYERAGGDTAEMTKTLAAAMQDPAAGALELNKKFGMLDATQLQYITTLQSQGKLQEAQVALFSLTTMKIEEQTKHTGLLARGWNFATNMISNYFDHLGKVAKRDFERATGISAGGFSDQEQVSRAKERLSSFEKTYQGPLAQPSLKFLREEVERLTAAQQKNKDLKAEEQFRQLSVEAWAAARAIMPATVELEKLTAQMDKIRAARMQSGEPVSGAEKVGNVRLVQIEQENAALVRQAEATSRIALMYPGMTIEGAKQLYATQQQTVAAQFVGTAMQLQAQQQASINIMVGQGKTLQEATAIATAQTGLAQMQITAQALANVGALEGQLSVAQARTGAEKMAAQEVARIAELIAQQVPPALAVKQAALEREISEAKVAEQIQNQIDGLNDQVRLIEAREAGTEKQVKAEMAYTNAIKRGATQEQASQLAAATMRAERAREDAAYAREAEQQQKSAQQAQQAAIQQNNQAIQQYNQRLAQAEQLAAKMADHWQNIPGVMVSINDQLQVMIDNIPQIKLWTDPNTGKMVQFNPEGYTSSTAGTEMLASHYARQREFYGSGKYTETPTGPFGTLQIKPNKEYWEALLKSTDATTNLTDSTNALNATMQNILSPFYSQDPRTTKLGFRAGTVANPDWMAGASNDNPMAAITGAGAVKGYADGGSFTVPGGYSSADNKIVSFAARSGETVTVGDPEQKPVTIDNRIIINGNVDQDTMAKLKRSQFQQSQRMRGMLAG